MSAQNLTQLLDKMWTDYTAINPLAQKIFDTLSSEGETLANDHIALRTFSHPRVSIDVIARPFLNWGYREGGEYHFPEKKLYAKHYQHSDPNMPKIFISQLKLEEFSPNLQNLVGKLVEQIPANLENAHDFTSIGRPWQVSTAVYDALLAESDYAAWVSAFGYRPNHFTVSINKLKKLTDITELNQFLKDQGFRLNNSGGEIKGSKDVLLEQSSTLANNIEVEFSDATRVVPACYYEFAKRYALANGELYQGFVAASADKIFESTSQGQ